MKGVLNTSPPSRCSRQLLMGRSLSCPVRLQGNLNHPLVSFSGARGMADSCKMVVCMHMIYWVLRCIAMYCYVLQWEFKQTTSPGSKTRPSTAMFFEAAKVFHANKGQNKELRQRLMESHMVWNSMLIKYLKFLLIAQILLLIYGLSRWEFHSTSPYKAIRGSEKMPLGVRSM